VRVALGHDRACTLPQIYAALSAAAAASLPAHPHLAQSHITHLFNVCTFNHRAPSLINVGLCGSEHLPNIEEHPFTTPTPSPTVEIIADGVHVHYLTIKSLLTARRPQDVAIITDSILSSKPGSQAAYCGRVIETAPDGAMVVLQGTTTLAGGCKPLWQAFAHLTGTLGVDLLEASVMFSTTPARIAR
jgi:N-acetylglucosamine-6-phosphate deacetylase